VRLNGSLTILLAAVMLVSACILRCVVGGGVTRHDLHAATASANSSDPGDADTRPPADRARPPRPAFDSIFRDPVIELRLQRAFAGAVVGAAMALAGVLLQCLLRNPLASPDLMGMASGAGLGVVLASYLQYALLGTVAQLGIAFAAGPALAGALGALALTYLLSQRRGFVDPPTLVLIGVIVGVLAAGLTVFLQHLLPDRGLAASRWLLGSISDDVTWLQIAVVGAVTLAALLAAVRVAPAMDAASLGDDEAASVGVNLHALRLFLFLASGALAAAAVVIAGPVAFVGLICPHLVRQASGPSHRTVVIASTLAGGALVVAADTLVKLIELPSGRLPIGVLTTLIGGPMLVWMLRSAPSTRWAGDP
jgi:iron complex transport system permease protein